MDFGANEAETLYSLLDYSYEYLIHLSLEISLVVDTLKAHNLILHDLDFS